MTVLPSNNLWYVKSILLLQKAEALIYRQNISISYPCKWRSLTMNCTLMLGAFEEDEEKLLNVWQT
jgi:hypothetical protein